MVSVFIVCIYKQVLKSSKLVFPLPQIFETIDFFLQIKHAYNVVIDVTHLTVFRQFTPHVQCERGKVIISCGVHIYIFIYVCGRKKYLNRTLEIDSPFQTFAVGLLVEFID